MSRFIDLTGRKFGKLTVLKRVEKPTEFKSKSHGIYWLCRCDCGNERVTETRSLKAGYNSSCGSPSCKIRVNMEGKTFGRLTVVRQVDRPTTCTSGIFWLCNCSCGNTTIMEGYSMRSGRNVSCGCYSRETRHLHRMLPIGEAALNELYKGYRANAKKRDLCFEITKDSFRKLTKQECYYCGAIPNQVARNNYDRGNYIYNGLDRVDNTKGYMIDNLVSCCGRCNRAKDDLSKEDFFKLIESIYAHCIENGNNNEN